MDARTDPADPADPANPADLADRVGPFYDGDGVRAVLGVSRTDLAAMSASRKLLSLPTGDGSTVYPAWQFTAGGETTPHLQDVLNALARGTDDAWTWALWLTAPDDDYAGLSAAGWLRAGRDPAPVLRDAASDAARWRT
jgi:hypothetical protein